MKVNMEIAKSGMYLHCVLLIIGLSACSSQQMYAIGQTMQRHQCMQMVEQSALDKCLQQAELPYEQYTHARGESLP